MIKELEEQLRIELRKKTILKAQCDQAYLRGVSAISMEALKMSQSTLLGHENVDIRWHQYILADP